MHPVPHQALKGIERHEHPAIGQRHHAGWILAQGRVECERNLHRREGRLTQVDDAEGPAAGDGDNQRVATGGNVHVPRRGGEGRRPDQIECRQRVCRHPMGQHLQHVDPVALRIDDQIGEVPLNRVGEHGRVGRRQHLHLPG